MIEVQDFDYREHYASSLSSKVLTDIDVTLIVSLDGNVNKDDDIEVYSVFTASNVDFINKKSRDFEMTHFKIMDKLSDDEQQNIENFVKNWFKENVNVNQYQ